MTGIWLLAAATVAIPAEFSEPLAELTVAPTLVNVVDRVEIGTFGWDAKRQQPAFWVRRTRSDRDGNRAETSWADSRSCDAVNPMFEGMRALPPQRFIGMPTVNHFTLDGVIFSLRTYSEDGEIEATSNYGTPLADWVEASMAALEPCWSSTVPDPFGPPVATSP